MPSAVVFAGQAATIHLNEFLIGHYIKYDIMRNI